MSSENMSEVEFRREDNVEAGNQTENIQTPPPQNRKQFILRVFSIAAFMIFVCLFIGAILNLLTEIQFKNSWNNVIFIYTQSVCAWVAFFFDLLRKKSPWNWILFSVFPAFFALIIATHLSFYGLPIITAAFISTILVSIVSILYGIYTKTDYTNFWELLMRFHLVLIEAFVILFIAGLFQFTIPEFHRIYCILNSLLRIFMLVFDVQRIMGKMRLKFHEDEIFPAILTIFIDVLYLLMFMLASIGDFGSGNGLNILVLMYVFV